MSGHSKGGGSGIVGGGIAYVPSGQAAYSSPDDGRVDIVRAAIEKHLKDWWDRPHESSGHMRVWPSDLTGCARKVVLRMRGEPESVTPAIRNKMAMRGGVFYEAETAEALKLTYGETAVTEQLRLQTNEWSGKPDFVLWHQEPHVTIVEHKATNSQWWDYKESLPQESHVAQLWIYGELYRELFGLSAKLVLFYRAWGHWAEFELVERHGDLVAVGKIDGFDRDRPLGPIADLVDERARLEGVFTAEFAQPLSALLPDKLSFKDDGCTWRGRPSCPYYDSCWGEGNE